MLAGALVPPRVLQVVREVRRQFEQFPGILQNTEKPEYGTCVSIVTNAALKEMSRPAVLALASPVVVGLVAKVVGGVTGQHNLAPEVLASFMLFGSLTGLLVAILLDNAGGAPSPAPPTITSAPKLPPLFTFASGLHALAFVCHRARNLARG